MIGGEGDSTIPPPGMSPQQPLHGRRTSSESNSFDKEGGQICPREGIFLVPPPPKTGKILNIPPPIRWTTLVVPRPLERIPGEVLSRTKYALFSGSSFVSLLFQRAIPDVRG